MPTVLRADREGGGRQLQPHGVLRVRSRVLLALYEGGLRLALLEVGHMLDFMCIRVASILIHFI